MTVSALIADGFRSVDSASVPFAGQTVAVGTEGAFYSAASSRCVQGRVDRLMVAGPAVVAVILCLDGFKRLVRMS